MKISVALCAVAVTITGCVSSGVQVKQEQLAGFKTGITTEAEVIQKLGRPTSSSISSDGSKMIFYSYFHSQARPASFIPIAGAFIGGADSQVNMTYFRFDKEGKLVSFNATESQHGSGTGLAAGRPIPQTDQPRQQAENASPAQ